MDYFSSNVAYLTFDQICDVNRRMINKKGGLYTPPNNLLNPGALEYILEDIIEPNLDTSDHLALKKNAAKMGHRIIAKHIFNDGNKRTGIHIAWEFLRANGVRVFIDPTIIDLTKSIALGNASIEDFYLWLKNHQEV